MNGEMNDSGRKDIARSFKRSSGWAKAFVGLAAVLVFAIVGIMATGAVSGGQAPGSAAAPAIIQDIEATGATPNGAVAAEDGSEVIADNETPMANGLETMQESAIGGGMRVLIVAGIAVTVVVFCWLMHRENRSISTMRRRMSQGNGADRGE